MLFAGAWTAGVSLDSGFLPGSGGGSGEDVIAPGLGVGAVAGEDGGTGGAVLEASACCCGGNASGTV